MAKALLSINKGESMKAISIKTRRMGLAASCIQMGICILGNLVRIKNMGRGPFIGLIYVHLLVSRKRGSILNSTMGHGGEAYQMERGNIQRAMVRVMLFR